MRSRRGWYVAAFVSSLAAVGRAEEPVAVRLRYSAPSTCPGETAFIDAVRARTPLARFGDDPGAWDVSVSAQSAGGRSSGVLSGQGTAPRRVSARNCGDVISALALILALAIDPQASASTVLAETPEEEPPPAPPPPPEAAPVRRPPAPPEPRAAVPRAAPGVRAFWGFGVALDGSAAFTSGWMSLVGPAASLELGARWSPFLSPSLRLSGALDFGSAGSGESGTASFRLARGRIDLRPVRLELAPTLFAIPYLGVEAGAITGEGEVTPSVTDTRTRRRAWLALAQGVALELELTHAAFLAISAEVREPLRRYEFVFRGRDGAVAVVPAVELAWSIGVAVRFW